MNKFLVKELWGDNFDPELIVNIAATNNEDFFHGMGKKT